MGGWDENDEEVAAGLGLSEHMEQGLFLVILNQRDDGSVTTSVTSVTVTSCRAMWSSLDWVHHNMTLSYYTRITKGSLGLLPASGDVHKMCTERADTVRHWAHQMDETDGIGAQSGTKRRVWHAKAPIFQS